MATAKVPFPGATSAVIFHAILELNPPPVLQANPALPPKLQEIIEKALEKDRELRYQSAADLRGDLRRLKRDVESGRKPGPSPVALGSGSNSASASGSGSVSSVDATAAGTPGSPAAVVAA